MHLLSESSVWETISEFVDPSGNVTQGKGETQIFVEGNSIKNESWADLGETRLENSYTIRKISDVSYCFESFNPSLGMQRGTFTVVRNILYSKFEVVDTDMDGFEVIVRNNSACSAYGALYRSGEVMSMWSAMMSRRDLI